MKTMKALPNILQLATVIMFCSIYVASAQEFPFDAETAVFGPVYSMVIDSTTTIHYDTSGKPIDYVVLHINKDYDDTIACAHWILIESPAKGRVEWQNFDVHNALNGRFQLELNSEGKPIKELKWSVEDGEERLFYESRYSYDEFGRIVRKWSRDLESRRRPDEEIITYETLPFSVTTNLRIAVTHITKTWDYKGDDIWDSLTETTREYYDMNGVLWQTCSGDSCGDKVEVLDIDSLGRPTRLMKHYAAITEKIVADTIVTETTVLYFSEYYIYDSWGNVVSRVETEYKNYKDCIADIDGVEESRIETEYTYDQYGNWTHIHWHASGPYYDRDSTSYANMKWSCVPPKPTVGEFSRSFVYYPSAPLPTATVR